MAEILPFDNTCVHPIAALKVVEPRECAQPGTDTYRRPGAMVGHTP
ncbi:pyridoxal-5'-phosphate-dependent protein subunit beta, partial [Mycobacterium avium subsp. hominissuis]